MKKQTINSFIPISTEELASLITIVEETIAIGFNYPPNKTFTAADLWNIQRQTKNRRQRRFY